MALRTQSTHRTCRPATAVVAVLALASIAAHPLAPQAAIVRSGASGPWTAPSTWAGGVLPAAGDTAVVAAPDTVRIDTVVVAPTDRIQVETGGRLEILAEAELRRAAPGPVSGWLLVDGEFSLRGTLSSENAAGADRQDLLLHARLGSAVEMRGDSLGTHRVQAILPSPAPSLLLELDVPVDDTATAVRTEGGWFDGAIHPVLARSEDRVRLAAGRLADRAAVVWADADSFAIDLAGVDPARLDGAVAVFDDEAARVDLALPGATGDRIVAFLDRALFGDDPPDSVDLLESIHPGLRLTSFRAARIEGASSAPADSLAAAALLLGGELQGQWFEFRWLADPWAAVQILGDASEMRLRDGWMHAFHTRYLCELRTGVIAHRAATLRLERVVLRDALGHDDGDWGHALGLNDLSGEDGLVLERAGVRNTLDDLVFAQRGDALTLDRVWAVDSRSGNVVDTKETALGMRIGVHACRIFGYGQNAIMADQGTAVWDLDDNLFVHAGSALNRDGIDGQNTGTGSSNGIYVVDVARFVSQRDTLRFTAAQALRLHPVAGADVRFEDTVLQSNGVWRVFGTAPAMDPSVYFSTPILGASDALDSVRLERVRVLEHPTRASTAVGTHPYAGIRGAVFARGLWALTGVQWGDPGGPPGRASETWLRVLGDATRLRLDHARAWFGRAEGVRIDAAGPGETATLAIERGVFRGSRRLIQSSRSVDLRLSTFVRHGDTEALRLDAPATTLLGCVFVDSAASVAPLRFGDANDTLGTHIDWNLWATAAPVLVDAGGTLLTAAAWTVDHDRNGLALDGQAQAWRDWLVSLDDPIPLADGPLVDFVDDPALGLDPDGSPLDAGGIVPGIATSVDPRPPAGTALRWRVVSATPARAGFRFALEGTLPDEPVRVEILDLRGRRVRLVHAGLVDATAELHWDGRDTRGHAAAAGVYFLRAVQGGRIATRPLVRLR